jgi:hypothetical protein
LPEMRAKGAMSINFTIDEKNPAFVRLSCRGIYTRDALLGVFDQAFDVAISKSRRAVLVEVWDVTGTPPDIFDRYRLGAGTVHIQREKAALVTIAVVGSEPMIDPRRLGETVFLNRGGIGKVFTDIDAAVAWLEEKEG